MKKKNKVIVARIRSCAPRLLEWAELTGKSESFIAEFFCVAGLAAIEDNKPIDAPSYRAQLTRFVEASKLRKQANALNKRASQLSRGKAAQ
jgi:hypothetical protein